MAMTNDLLDDLKQFIDARISQTEARFDEKLDEKIDELRTEIHTELRNEIGGLRSEMRDGFAGIADAMEEQNKHTDARLTKLEERVV